MHLHLTLLMFILGREAVIGVPLSSRAHELEDTLKGQVATPAPETLFSLLDQQDQEDQAQSFAETLLERSSSLFGNFNQLRESLQNATEQRSDLQLRLHSLNKRARHLRHDIEDEIETQKQNPDNSDEVVAELRIKRLEEAAGRLRSIDHISRRTRVPREKPHYRQNTRAIKSRRGTKSSSKDRQSASKSKLSTQRPSAQSTTPPRPNMNFGLGDGFGRHD